MKEKANSYVDMIRLTLDKVADADVIAALQAMPYGSKSRIVAHAIRQACRAVGDSIEIVQPDKPLAVQLDPRPTQPEPTAPISVEVDTF